ncbi:ExbD/TolR family protein [Lacibacter sp. H407]|uniref:ExbD/TolR family protein n=1 Tax=Lacibacter sp. H407 TaxID=3133423 RepID=UPI0030BD2EBF
MKRKKVILLIAVLLLFVIATPVVFFYITTRMSSPKTVVVNADKTKGELISPDSTVTVLISGVNEFIYYKNNTEAKKGSLEDVRTFLVKEEVAKNSFTVLIVPLETTAYKNTVDILDEMQINKIMKYAIVDVKKEDIDLANKLK